MPYLKLFGQLILYLIDRIFSAIVLGVVLAIVLAELIRRGYLG